MQFLILDKQTEPSMPLWKMLAILGVIAVLIVICLLVIKKLGELNAKTDTDPTDELIAKQTVVTTLSPLQVSAWLRENLAYVNRDDTKVFAVRTTKDWLQKLGYNQNIGLDPEHNVIIFAADTKGNTYGCRLISFSEMSSEVAGYFGKNDVFVVDK